MRYGNCTGSGIIDSVAVRKCQTCLTGQIGIGCTVIIGILQTEGKIFRIRLECHWGIIRRLKAGRVGFIRGGIVYLDILTHTVLILNDTVAVSIAGSTALRQIGKIEIIFTLTVALVIAQESTRDIPRYETYRFVLVGNIGKGTVVCGTP